MTSAMFRAVVIALVLVAANARADGPWGVVLAAGPALQRDTAGRVDPSFTLGASASLDAGYRFLDSEAVGAALGEHLGISYVRSTEYGGDGPQDAPVDTTSFPIALGLSTQLVIADRFQVAPWGGFVFMEGGRFNAGGVEVGFDIAVHGAERLSAVATYVRAGHIGFGLETIGVGIGYRYW
jgi:hypothetical protein